MGVTRSDLFTERQNALSKVAKALAHPARIAIIDHLLESKSCINSHLVDELGLAQATISQHLRELKEVGIIKGSIEGSSISYCIDKEKWEEIRLDLNTLFNQYFQANSNQDCC